MSDEQKVIFVMLGFICVLLFIDTLLFIDFTKDIESIIRRIPMPETP